MSDLQLLALIVGIFGVLVTRQLHKILTMLTNIHYAIRLAFPLPEEIREAEAQALRDEAAKNLAFHFESRPRPK